MNKYEVYLVTGTPRIERLVGIALDDGRIFDFIREERGVWYFAGLTTLVGGYCKCGCKIRVGQPFYY